MAIRKKSSKKKEVRKEKIAVGWREYVDLPEWGIRSLRAKIDTGARTSSLHVEDVKELSGNHISFHVILNKSKVRKTIKAKYIKQGHVKSSTGSRTHRWYVEAKIRFGTIECVIPINLVDREGMNYRMLIGRNAIKGLFTVDVSRSYLLKKKIKRKPAAHS